MEFFLSTHCKTCNLVCESKPQTWQGWEPWLTRYQCLRMYCSEDSLLQCLFYGTSTTTKKKRSSIRSERNISVQWISVISWSLKWSFCSTLKLTILQIGVYILKIWQTWKKHFFFIQERLVSVRACLPLLVTQQLLRAYRIGTNELGFTVRAMSKLLVFLQADSLHLIFIWNGFFFTFGLELCYVCVNAIIGLGNWCLLKISK